jgi:hypothetical protein
LTFLQEEHIMIDTSGPDWITYFPDPDRKQKMPESGFVEFTNTFNPDELTSMDMNVNNIERNLWWNRAAPRCVAKYRYITEEVFIQRKISWMLRKIDNIEESKQQFRDGINECKKRLDEISNKG